MTNNDAYAILQTLINSLSQNPMRGVSKNDHSHYTDWNDWSRAIFTFFALALLDIHMHKYTVAENRATERVSRSAGRIQWLPVLFSDH